MNRRLVSGSLVLVCCVVMPTYGLVVPFTEDFTSDSADWRDAASTPLTWVSSGGPDGGAYATTTFSLAASSDGDTPVLFRAQDKFGSSGGAFEGDWISGGVLQFRAFVRHNAPFPLTFFTRFSGPANFPGAVGVHFVPVFGETWTEIVFDINPSSPQFISFEGSDFNTVFSNIGHLQIGVSVGDGQGGFPVPIQFDIDKVTVANCLPDCAGRVCGDDGCGGSCGTCAEGEECTPDGACVTAPIPTVSEWGLVTLALLLLVGAKLMFSRSPGRVFG